IVVTTKAPAGTSPWSVPPLATFPAGFQLIGQNGLRTPPSTLNEDLFLRAIGDDCSADLFFKSTGAGSFSALLGGAVDAGLAAGGAGLVSAASRAGDARIEIQMIARILFIVSRSR